MRVDKANVDRYLEVHRTAHNLGMRTHTTMLYGSIESYEDRVNHMVQIRELQDETNGFMVFIPLSMQPKVKTRALCVVTRLMRISKQLRSAV